MAQRKAKAKMGCSKKQYQKVVDRGKKVSEGLYENDVLYAEPPIVKDDFNKQQAKASDAQAVVKGGSIIDTDNRDTQVGLLYDWMNDKLLLYVNGLWMGNRTNLLASGFEVTGDTQPHEVPAPRVINRMERGVLPFSAKIYLAKTTGDAKNKKERLTYFVWMRYVDEDDKLYRVVLTTTSKFKLLVSGLVKGREAIFYVTCRNNAGESDKSNCVNFIAF